jgi:hypothetical protein
VDHKWVLIALVHGAFLALVLCLRLVPALDAMISSSRMNLLSSLWSCGLTQWSSSDICDKPLNREVLVWVDRDVDGLLDS